MNKKINKWLMMLRYGLSHYKDRKELNKDIKIQKISGWLDEETEKHYREFIESIISEEKDNLKNNSEHEK